ncbi:hypothetical protein WN51_02852 [Melipona quadrifasciata]|uniref:Uncharacterized protein n=1 Tax=Melipona quadrifasciata TaxID=166423 RepID=A0A0M9AA36_9HYME|nr:hypothetical protein WN51_02852 [Melipona quadrifasciata]
MTLWQLSKSLGDSFFYPTTDGDPFLLSQTSLSYVIDEMPTRPWWGLIGDLRPARKTKRTLQNNRRKERSSEESRRHLKQPPPSDECFDGFGHAHPAGFHRTPTNGDPCQPILLTAPVSILLLTRTNKKRKKERNSMENLQPKRANPNLSPTLEVALEEQRRSSERTAGQSGERGMDVPAVSQAFAISSTFRCLNATKNDEDDEEEDGFWWAIARPKLPRSQ